MKTRRIIFAGHAFLALALSANGTSRAQQTAPQPNIENGKLETRAVSGSLDAAFQSITSQAENPEWVGYTVAEVAGERSVCCGNFNNGVSVGCQTCRLEKEHGAAGEIVNPRGALALEGGQQLLVLYRLEAKHVTQIRVASEDCALDAGGLPFIWLTDVKSTESVSLLKEFAGHGNFEEHGEHETSHGALMAIALHADVSADHALESFVAPDESEALRKQAAFWMGAARGKVGLTALQRLAKNDPSSEVRAHVAFALSVSHEPAALDEMIRMAHDDGNSHVRGQALFWLAQKAGKKAVGTITGAIDDDPDTDVKKKAVFALSQLPKDEGVPKLIQVAQTNHNAEVRKQAMFWLGQSNDPRALHFFEKVLSQ
jgi:HEAT repeat protein